MISVFFLLFDSILIHMGAILAVIGVIASVFIICVIVAVIRKVFVPSTIDVHCRVVLL